MLISLIHPSRGRPQKAKATYDYWISRARHPEYIEHILSLDDNDPELGKYPEFDFQNIISNNSDCVVAATNHAAKIATGKILVYLSDDFLCPEWWDFKIFDYLTIVQKSGIIPWMLKVNDGYQPMENNVLTIPIMNRKLYEKLGYFFNPLYKSMWCDVDLHNTCEQFITFAPDLIFEHQHPVTGKCETDETYQRSDLNFETGRAIYNARALEFGWKTAFKKMP